MEQPRRFVTQAAYIAWCMTTRNIYVCSDPIRIESETLEEAASHLAQRLTTGETLRSVVRRLFHADASLQTSRTPAAQEARARTSVRMDFLERIRGRAESDDDAIAITIAAEAWAKGTLTIFASKKGK
jgi:hypothetical protein